MGFDYMHIFGSLAVAGAFAYIVLAAGLRNQAWGLIATLVLATVFEVADMGNVSAFFWYGYIGFALWGTLTMYLNQSGVFEPRRSAQDNGAPVDTDNAPNP